MKEINVTLQKNAVEVAVAVPSKNIELGIIGIQGPAGATGADGLTVSVNSVTQVAGDISLTQDNIPDGTTNKAYTAAEQTKLSGIEALADVTDATNVAAAGAVMDGDFSSNGVMTRTASGTYANRTLTGTANQITVTNGDGVSGNPTLSLPQNIHTGATPTFARAVLDNSAAAASSYLHIKSDATPSSALEAQLDLYSGATYARHFYRDSDKNYGFFVNGTTRIRIIGGTGEIQLNGNTTPYGDSTYTLGNSSNYWSNTYTDRLYLNSTAYLDGAAAGQVGISGLLRADNIQTQSLRSNDTNSLVRISGGPTNDGAVIALTGSTHLYAGTGLLRKDTTEIAGWSASGVHIGSDPTKIATHSLTLQSNATGIALYNTADQTTNYERAVHSFSGGNYKIETNFGGSGANKNIQLSTISSQFTVAYAQLAAGSFQLARGLSIANTAHTVLSGSQTQSSGTVTMLSIAPTINQTSTASYTALLINPTETTTGSGTKYLINAQVGGSSKFSVTNTGATTLYSLYTNSWISTGSDITMRGGNLRLTSNNNIELSTTTGTKIGTTNTEKLAFFGATPVVQPSGTSADATDLATAITLVNNLKSKLVTLGLIA